MASYKRSYPLNYHDKMFFTMVSLVSQRTLKAMNTRVTIKMLGSFKIRKMLPLGSSRPQNLISAL